MTNQNITVGDLRRALVTYLVGFGLYLAVVSFWIGQGLSEFATPPSGTVSETPVLDVAIPVLAVVSVLIMVLSQVWYLWMRQHWRRSEDCSQFLYRVRAKVGVLVLLFLALVVFVYPDPFKRAFWASFFGASVYFFVIVLRNIFSVLGRK